MPSTTELHQAVRSLTLRQKLFASAFFLVGSLSLLMAFWLLNESTLVEVPEEGGSMVEGVIGAPRFINPLLAISDTDRDLVALIYSGLLRKTAEGELIPDLAEHYTISKDGREYTFVLKDNLTWHDGIALSAADVAYTVNILQNPITGSVRSSIWQGVSTKVVNKKTIIFTTPEPRSSFLNQLTTGIMPAHIWKDVPMDSFAFSTHNELPVGSGAYMIADIKKTSTGVPEYYDLVPFTNFSLGRAHISQVRFSFFPNENDLLEAYDDGKIDSLSGIAPTTAIRLARTGSNVKTAALPRVFGIFFNQNQAELFTQKEVREALSLTLDKKYIVSNILKEYATAIDGPLPPGAFGYQKADLPSTPLNSRLATAQKMLDGAGWTKNSDGILTKKGAKANYILEFTITTADTPELKAIAELAKTQWERLGAKVEIRILDQSALQQNAIRPRKYDVLLFGMATGLEGDLYPFWHSHERLDPGLNVAMYTNPAADKLLEKARIETNEDLRKKDITELYQIIKKDIPAIFIYSPNFVYIVPKQIAGFDLGNISSPADRLLPLYQAYTETQKIWPFFVTNRPENIKELKD